VQVASPRRRITVFALALGVSGLLVTGCGSVTPAPTDHRCPAKDKELLDQLRGEPVLKQVSPSLGARADLANLRFPPNGGQGVKQLSLFLSGSARSGWG
jgi:hypothetical protein